MTHDQVQSIQILLACHHQNKFLLRANMQLQKTVMNLLSKQLFTALGCDAAGCSSQAGFPSFSPVLRLYKQSGKVAIVPESKFLHLATEGTLIASSRPTGLNANGRK
jgi:hypothetical protein